MAGKTAVVTGATSGIGFEAMKELLRAGMNVIGIGRDEGRIERAKKELEGLGEPGFVLADLSTGGEVAKAAAEIGALAQPVDALLHVAGAVSGWYVNTPEGYELTFATNHLAPYRLTHALLPILSRGARVVTVSSNSHRGAKIHWDDVMLHRRYHNLTAYKQSKLCNVLFTMELHERLGGRLVALTFDPGLMRTEIGLKNTKPHERFVWQMRMRQAQDPSVAGTFLAAMAADEKFSGCGGQYYQLGVQKPPYAKATSESARRLWALSAQLSGIGENWDEFTI